MAQMIDHVLALFPFEPPYMEAEGMACDFVGHPAANAPRATPEDCAIFRTEHGLEKAAPLILVLPGSRRGEVARMGPVFGEVLGALAQSRPDMRMIVPAAPAVADAVQAQVKDWPVHATVIDIRQMDGETAQATKRTAFAAADVALATSGTVALELAAAGTPMVSAFDLNWLSRIIIPRLLITDTTCLVNLVTDSHVVPELIGFDFTADKVRAAMETLLADPSVQASAMEQTMDLLGRGGEDPGLRAARAVLDRL